MPRKRVNWKVAGAAGAGVKSTGEAMAKGLARAGYWVMGYTEYPSLIRGGHNTYQVWADSEKQAWAPRKELDVLVALNQAAVAAHKTEWGAGTVLVADEGLNTEGVGAKVVKLPILKKATELGNPLIQNVITWGWSAAELGVSLKIMEGLVEEAFGKKKEMLEMNLAALWAGWEMHQGAKEAGVGKGKGRLVLTGNEALALGAIAAGVNLYAAYPMTPSTPVLHYLAAIQLETGMVVRQVEDEISAINLAIGASYAGARAMVGTSGGGFALMSEAVALSGMVEVPLVVYVGMRPGPATGLPTWSSQADLRFVIHAGHGEFAKIVLTPGDVVEAYEAAHRAVELSQKYQTVVIVLMDKYLAESTWSVEGLAERQVVPLGQIETTPTQPEGEMFARYKLSPTGVSKRTLPGMVNGWYVANADEHEVTGLADETVEVRNMMTRKRMLKHEAIKGEMGLPRVYGSEKAKWSLVGWGSTKSSLLAAMEELSEVNVIHFSSVWPWPEGVGEILAGRRLVFVENNMMGQFEGLVREMCGVVGEKSLRKDDGRPFYPEEIVDFVKQLR